LPIRVEGGGIKVDLVKCELTKELHFLNNGKVHGFEGSSLFSYKEVASSSPTSYLKQCKNGNQMIPIQYLS
jgi:hypothetical protein